MLHNDRLTLALLLCKIHLKGVHNEPGLDSEFQFFLRGKEGMLNARVPVIDGLNQDQLEALSRLATRWEIILMISSIIISIHFWCFIF